MLTPHAALIYAMVVVSASDREMSDQELAMIGGLVTHLPCFRGYDPDRLVEDARACGTMVRQEDGFRRTLDAIADALPHHLRETCYLLACDVAGAKPPGSDGEARSPSSVPRGPAGCSSNTETCRRLPLRPPVTLGLPRRRP